MSLAIGGCAIAAHRKQLGIDDGNVLLLHKNILVRISRQTANTNLSSKLVEPK